MTGQEKAGKTGSIQTGWQEKSISNMKQELSGVWILFKWQISGFAFVRKDSFK